MLYFQRLFIHSQVAGRVYNRLGSKFISLYFFFACQLYRLLYMERDWWKKWWWWKDISGKKWLNTKRKANKQFASIFSSLSLMSICQYLEVGWWRCQFQLMVNYHLPQFHWYEVKECKRSWFHFLCLVCVLIYINIYIYR